MFRVCVDVLVTGGVPERSVNDVERIEDGDGGIILSNKSFDLFD